MGFFHFWEISGWSAPAQIEPKRVMMTVCVEVRLWKNKQQMLLSLTINSWMQTSEDVLPV